MKRITLPLLIGLGAATAVPAMAERITFYQDDNFRGRSFSAERQVANFGRDGFNDRVHSAVVHEGRWEICVDADFSGGCAVLAPGAYPSLGAYAGRISSVRPVDDRTWGVRGDGRGDNRGDNRHGGRTARATLYEGPNLSGRAYPLDNVMANLSSSGFNDRATSLRVDSGYWVFCSDAEFRGECRTFGPGDYATLPGLNNSISSGRWIANAYPYRDRPDWQRDAYPPMQTYDNRR